MGLGLLAARLGQASEAAQDFRAALVANPLSAEAHYQLGLILELHDQKPEAVREFHAALQINPQYTAARAELAKLNPPAR
jgi:tetratricopeptide (TPR) repeat protein